MFWVQVVVGLGTLALAWVSSSAARRAVESSRVANALSEKASEDAAAAHRRDAEKIEREQASKIWVSMIVITDPSKAGAPIHGVLLIRNSSDRPVSDIRILSRGWSSAKKHWFVKEKCRITVVYPGDTTVASRNSKTDWDVPEHYFPHFGADYNHAGGPRDDPYYVQLAEFTDADGRRWHLTSGHRLERAEAAA